MNPEVVETITEATQPEEVDVQSAPETSVNVQETTVNVQETTANVPEPSVVEPVKKKRKRTEAQVNALANARKSKQNKHKILKKGVKIERGKDKNSEEGDFSWPKEIAKASLLAGLGLASVFVQQRFAQNQIPSVIVATEVKPTLKEEEQPSLKRQNTSVGDPFGPYR